jgi:hypothetical protein
MMLQCKQKSFVVAEITSYYRSHHYHHHHHQKMNTPTSTTITTTTANINIISALNYNFYFSLNNYYY